MDDSACFYNKVCEWVYSVGWVLCVSRGMRMTDGRFGEGSWRTMPESLMCGSLCLELPCSIARSLGPACLPVRCVFLCCPIHSCHVLDIARETSPSGCHKLRYSSGALAGRYGEEKGRMQS